MFERYPEDYSDYLLNTPQVLPSSHIRAGIGEVLQKASHERVTNKEFARILSAWGSAILIILAHRLLGDGHQLLLKNLQDPLNLGLVGLVATLFILSFVLHRKRKLGDVLEDFSELLGRLHSTPEAIRKDSSTQEVIDRIKSTLDGYGIASWALGHAWRKSAEACSGVGSAILSRLTYPASDVCGSRVSRTSGGGHLARLRRAGRGSTELAEVPPPVSSHQFESGQPETALDRRL